jgi:ribosome-binding factor A
VGQFLTGDVRDPRIGFVTVIGVDVSADLSHANVRVSVMGTEEEKAQPGRPTSAARYLRAARTICIPHQSGVGISVDRGIEHAQRTTRSLAG